MTISRAHFARIVDETLEELPEWVLEQIDNLVVVVEDAPRPHQDSAGEGLLGVYEGVSLAERGMDYFGQTPDRIIIFYRPHLDLGLSDEDLRVEVHRTVLHEIAHHLGIDDDRLHDLGWD
jgi:predicted Zn-dependent protease with MMP-like domain